jgi:DNA-binding MarR family transcriptional regulator
MIKSSPIVNESDTGQPDPLLAAIHRVRSVLAPELMEVLLGLNLTMAQFQTLVTIWRGGRMCGRQIARELGVTPAAVVALCDRLEEQGYVQRVRDQVDRRVWWCTLTPAGHELFERLTAVPRSRLVPALSALSAGDRDRLIRILHRLGDALEAG